MILTIGIGMFFMKLASMPINDWLASNYWKIFLGTILIEIFLIQIVFPREKIECSIQNNKDISFQYKRDKKFSEVRTIKKFSYWWNYKFGDNQRYGDDLNWNSTNSGLGEGGTANNIWIYIKLIDEEKNEILLYEKIPHWATRPHWEYSLETADATNEKYLCFSLENLVKQLDVTSKTQ